MFDRRLPSCCVACDRPMVDGRAVHPEGHPYAGLPRGLRQFLPEARRVTFALSDGSRCDLTFCEDCATALTPEQYPALWRKCLGAFAYENQHYARLSAVQQARTPEQQKAVDADLLRMSDMALLGVLAVATFDDVKRREKAERVILGR